MCIHVLVRVCVRSCVSACAYCFTSKYTYAAYAEHTHVNTYTCTQGVLIYTTALPRRIGCLEYACTFMCAHRHTHANELNVFSYTHLHVHQVFSICPYLCHLTNHLISSPLEVPLSKSCRHLACRAPADFFAVSACLSLPPVFTVFGGFIFLGPLPFLIDFLSRFSFCCLVLDLSTGSALAPHSLVLADAAAATFLTSAPHSLVLADAAAWAVFALASLALMIADAAAATFLTFAPCWCSQMLLPWQSLHWLLQFSIHIIKEFVVRVLFVILILALFRVHILRAIAGFVSIDYQDLLSII